MYPLAAFQLYIIRAMEIAGISEKTRGAGWTDEEIVERVKSGDTALYEIIMRRYNQGCIALRARSCTTMTKRKT